MQLNATHKQTTIKQITPLELIETVTMYMGRKALCKCILAEKPHHIARQIWSTNETGEEMKRSTHVGAPQRLSDVQRPLLSLQ